MASKKSTTKNSKTDKHISSFYSYRNNLAQIFFVVMLFLTTRILSSFILIYFWSQSYTIRIMYGFLPVIAMSTEFGVFTRINSYSMLASAVVVFIYFLVVMLKQNNQNLPKGYVRNERTIAFVGYLMTVLQYLIALAINRILYFSTDWRIGIPIFVLFIITLNIYMFRMKD